MHPAGSGRCLPPPDVSSRACHRGPHGWSACRSSTSPRCSASVVGDGRGRGRADRRPRARQPGGGAALPRGRAPRGSGARSGLCPRLCTVSRRAGDARGGRGALAPRPTASSWTRWAGGGRPAGNEDGNRRALLAIAERGSKVLIPDPGYPDYTSGVALAGAELVPLPLVRAEGWAPDLDAVPARDVAAVYLNYPSNPVRRGGATPGCSPRSSTSRSGRRRRRPRLRLRRPRLRRAAPPRASSPRPGAKEVGVELFSNVQDVRHGGLAARLRGGERGAGRADQPAVGPLGASASSRRSRRLPFAALHGSAGLGRGAPPPLRAAPGTSSWPRSAPRCRARPSARARSTSGSSCRGGVTPATLLAEQRVVVAPGEGFGSRGAGWARLSLAVTDEALELGLERVRRALTVS